MSTSYAARLVKLFGLFMMLAKCFRCVHNRAFTLPMWERTLFNVYPIVRRKTWKISSPVEKTQGGKGALR